MVKYDGKTKAAAYVAKAIEEVFKAGPLDVLEVTTERSKSRKNCGKYESWLK